MQTEVAGERLADPAALSDWTTRLAESWGASSPRVAGTLWWYMAADTLLATPVAAIARGGPVPDPRLAALRCVLRPDGGVDRIRHVGTISVDDAPAALGETLEQIVATLAIVSDAGPAALRAVTSDAIATRALAAVGPAEADGFATRLACAMDGLPRPRFVDVGGRRFVHRNSCCLMCDLARPQMCVSCPKRLPEERRDLLARVAAGH